MDLTLFYRELRRLLPSEQGEGIDFREHLSKILKKYRSLLEQLNEEERPDEWEQVIIHVDKLSSVIREVVKRYYQGHQSLAYNLLRKQIETSLQIACVIPKNRNWYRMRCANSNLHLNYQDMFHIPLNMRGIVKTERYSFPGYPCLYLGSTIYDCWEELHRPSLNSAYVSRVCNTSQLIMLDMTIPDLNGWLDVDGKKRLQIELPRLPLIIASMIKVKNSNDVFKPEYIIPQLLMELVLKQQNKSIVQYSGIYYSSVCENQDFNFREESERTHLMHNLAIPVKRPLLGRYCAVLCNQFKITNPTSDEMERVKGNYPSSHQTAHTTPLSDYTYSLFGELEKRLSNEELFPLNTISYTGK